MKKGIQFTDSRPIPRTKDSTEYAFDFMIDNKKSTEIKVSISGTLVAVWFQNDYTDIENILFQFAKHYLIEQLKKDTLLDQEEVILSSSKQPSQCPYKKSDTVLKHGETFEIEIKDKK